MVGVHPILKRQKRAAAEHSAGGFYFPFSRKICRCQACRLGALNNLWRNASNAMQREMDRERHKTDKASPTKPKKLSARQKELADRLEVALGEQWVNDAGKWIGRIKTDSSKSERVIAEVESAVKEN
jgi:hypothetical protein